MIQDTFSNLVEALEARILTASPSECPALVGTMERLKALAWGRMTTSPTAPATTNATGDPSRYLTVEEVSARFGVSDRWLYRHKKQMPHSQPSRKLLLFPEKAIEKWFASRKAH